jgi:hypothetical protein
MPTTFNLGREVNQTSTTPFTDKEESTEKKDEILTTFLHAKCGELAIECDHAATSVANVVEVSLGSVRQNVLTPLNDAPHRPHGM